MIIKVTGKALWQWIKKSGAQERTANTEGSKKKTNQRGQQRMEKELSKERKELSKSEVQWRQKYI